MNQLPGLARIALEERNHPEFAGGAILPTFLAKLDGELSDLLPVAERGLHIPLKVDVALDGQPAQAEAAITRDDRAGEVPTELGRQVSEGVDLHLAA